MLSLASFGKFSTKSVLVALVASATGSTGAGADAGADAACAASRASLLASFRASTCSSSYVPSNFAVASDFVFANAMRCRKRARAVAVIRLKKLKFRVKKRGVQYKCGINTLKIAYDWFIEEGKALHALYSFRCIFLVFKNNPCLPSKFVCPPSDNINYIPELTKYTLH